MTAVSAPGQLFDTPTAQEFMREAMEQISEQEMGAIQAEAREKSRRFRALLGAPDPTLLLSAGALRGILRSIFPVRRRAEGILEATGSQRLAALMGELLHGERPLDDRLPAFCSGVSGVDRPLAVDLACELLHFTFPERWWLWTRWIWDPDNDTGALRLVTTDAYDLRDADEYQTYLRVGRATAFVQETGAAAGLHQLSHAPFGVDVFLACVYGVYMYTVLRLRMTREFNQCVPALPQLARRLLGVHGMEV